MPGQIDGCARRTGTGTERETETVVDADLLLQRGFQRLRTGGQSVEFHECNSWCLNMIGVAEQRCRVSRADKTINWPKWFVAVGSGSVSKGRNQ